MVLFVEYGTFHEFNKVPLPHETTKKHPTCIISSTVSGLGVCVCVCVCVCAVRLDFGKMFQIAH